MSTIVSFIRYYDFWLYQKLYDLGQQSQYWSDLFYFFARYGLVFFLLSFTYLIWKKRVNAFLCSFMAMGIAGMVDLIISLFWNRPKPSVSHAGITLPPLSNLDIVKLSSFPSSHTYIVFAIAISVYLYGHKKLGSILFVLAFAVALGRIGTGLHYPSDTIAGALLGLLSGVMAFRFVHHNQHKWEYND